MIRNGDIISIDIPNNSITLDLTDEEIESRFEELPKFEPRIKKGYLGRYARMVTSANTGAILQIPE